MKGVDPKRSLPSVHAPRHDEAIELGLRFELNRDSYWSSVPLLERYFEDILVPHFQRVRDELASDDDQEAVVLLDCWSCHRSKEFRRLVHRRWPWLRLRFVPGGMTGLAQPCDVGMQRPYKLSIKRSQLQDVFNETLRQLDKGVDPSAVRLDNTIGTLRDRSVGWFLKAWQDVNVPSLVKKVRARYLLSATIN